MTDKPCTHRWPWPKYLQDNKDEVGILSVSCENVTEAHVLIMVGVDKKEVCCLEYKKENNKEQSNVITSYNITKQGQRRKMGSDPTWTWDRKRYIPIYIMVYVTLLDDHLKPSVHIWKSLNLRGAKILEI